MNNPAFYYGQGAPQMAGAGRGMPSTQMGGPPPHYMQQAAFRNMPPGTGSSDPAAMQQPPHSQQHHHRSKRTSNKAGALVEDNDEPSGDELDDISARDIAMARYKRNHDYLSEIFTPYSAASIVPPPLEIPQSKDDITKAIENEEKSISERTNKFEERLQALKQKQEGYWKLLKQLEGANGVEQFDEATKEFKNATGIKLEHVKENVQSIPIPGLEQDEPPVQQPQTTGNRRGDHQPQHQNGFVADFMNARVAAAGGNNNNNNNGAVPGNGDIPSSGSMGMFGSYAPSDSNANQSGVDDSQNDFFDEMVNTGQDDDGGSVSEFLNSDMDFEQATDNKPLETTHTSEDVTMTEATISSLTTTTTTAAPTQVSAPVTSSMEQDTQAVSSFPSLNPSAPATVSTTPTASTPVVSETEPPNQAHASATTQQEIHTSLQVQAQPAEQTTSQGPPPQTVPNMPVQVPVEEGKTNEGIPNP